MNGFIMDLQAMTTWIGFAWLLAIMAAIISHRQLKSERTINKQRQSTLRKRYQQLLHQHAIKLKVREKHNKRLLKTISRLNAKCDAAIDKNDWTHQLLTNMSHEIRTPLNAIIGFTELILMSPDRASVDNLKHIQSAGNHLMNLINDILDLSHLESKSFNLNEQTFQLHTLLEECCQMMTPQLKDSTVLIQPSFDESVYCEIKFDRTRLLQILINLLSNAVKYTPSGHIKISAFIKNKPDSWLLNLSINDTGLGMTEEQVAQILEPHTQFHQNQCSVKNTGVQSTGLGMAITDQLIRHMNGELQVHSTPNVGTDIKVILPILSYKPSKNCIPQLIGSDADDKVAEELHHYPVIKVPLHPVLLVDDQLENLTLIECFMNKLGIKYVSCRSGIEALSLYKKSEFSFVFMDIRMPLMDGIETLRLMQQLQSKKCTYVALSANAMISDINTALAAGFNHYLTKPLRMNELCDLFTKQYNMNVAEPAGIYWNKALEITGQDEALAISMIEQLIKRIPEMIETIESCHSNHEFDAELLHRWQGMICYAGAIRLNRLVSILESSVKETEIVNLTKIKQELIRELHLVMAQGLNAINRERNHFSAITVATA